MSVPYPVEGFGKGGAPLYMAPEIYGTRPGPTAALNYSLADMWSLGLVLATMASGRDVVKIAPTSERKADIISGGPGARPMVHPLAESDPLNSLVGGMCAPLAQRI